MKTKLSIVNTCLLFLLFALLLFGNASILANNLNNNSENLPFIVTATATPASCYFECGGSIVLEITGGFPPFEYEWSNGITEQNIEYLCPDTYSVTATDSNDSSSSGCVAANPGSCDLETEIATQDVLCYGACDGNVALVVTGGSPPYAFEWNNGSLQCDVPDACAGTYIVTVTDTNGCTITSEATVTEPTPLLLEMTSTDETAPGANDGTATANVSGGTCCYTETWDTDPPQSGTTITNLTPGTYCVTITDNNVCTVSNCTLVNPFSCDISLEISNDNFTCADICNGMIDLTVLGGEEPFTYDWSSAQIGDIEDPDMLCMGNYSVTVTDSNGCSATISTTVEELTDEMILSFESIPQSCLDICDGAFDLTVEEGAPPYTYLWSNGATTEDIDSLCFGELYQVTVTDANGCTKVGTPIIFEPTYMSIFEEVTGTSCLGGCDGSIDITVTGATEPIDYDWSDDSLDGIEDPVNLCAGSYELTVTDVNGCSAIVSIFVDSPWGLSVAASKTDASCFGECDGFVDFFATGGTPPYSFSGSFEMLCVGDYTITVTDSNGCTTLFSFEITEPDEIEISVDEIGNETNTQSDGFVNITVEGGTMPYSYDWMLNGSTVSTAEDPTGLAAGTYTLEVTDANGCVIILEGIIVDNIVTIIDPDLKKFIDVFPNPTNGVVQIEFDLKEKEIVEIEVFDFTGKKILEQKERNVLNQKLQFDLSAFSEGVYTLKINIGNAFLIERIVKHD